MDEWTNHVDIEVLYGHTIFFALEKECYSFTVRDEKVIREEVAMLVCCHEEADTRIMFHLHHILAANTGESISIRSSDTDVFILLIYHVSNHTTSSTVWMDFGLSSNNTRRYINISQLVDHLPQDVIDALPALHAFTGSDYTASMMNKGKLKALELMMKSDIYTQAFAGLGNSDCVHSTNLVDIERFTCALYGMRKLRNINDVRFAMFQQKYAPRKRDAPLNKILGINPSSMPPCQSVLINKIHRTNYVACLWRRATLPTPCTMKAEAHGWSLENGTYKIKWYDGDQLPQSVLEILNDGNTSTSEEADIDQAAYDSSDDSDYEDDEYIYLC